MRWWHSVMRRRTVSGLPQIMIPCSIKCSIFTPPLCPRLAASARLSDSGDM